MQAISFFALSNIWWDYFIHTVLIPLRQASDSLDGFCTYLMYWLWQTKNISLLASSLETLEFLYWPWQTSVCWPFHWRPWVWVPVRPSCCGRDGRLSGVARGRAAGGGSWPGSCDVSAHTWHSHPPSSSTPSGPPSRKQTSQNDQFCLVLALYSRKRKHYKSCQYSLLPVHCQDKILITVVFNNNTDFHC